MIIKFFVRWVSISALFIFLAPLTLLGAVMDIYNRFSED